MPEPNKELQLKVKAGSLPETGHSASNNSKVEPDKNLFRALQTQN